MKSKSKKDANIKFNSTLFFQIGLIISIITVTTIINTTFGIELKKPITPPVDKEEVWMGQYIIVEPKPQIEIEPKKVVRKINPDKIIITDKEITDQPVIDTDPEPEVVSTPVVSTPTPEPPKEDNNTYSLIGVERVPIFPGCESLSNNNQRRDCMSSEIGKIINRRFDTGIASDLGLNGSQRIYVTFIINKKGEIKDIQVRAPHPRLEREANRVVMMVPKMMPGLQNNREVDVMFTLPIIFNVIN